MAATSHNQPLTRKRLPLQFKQAIWMVSVFAVVNLALTFVLLIYQSHAIEGLFNDRAIKRASTIAAMIAKECPDVSDARMTELSAQQVLPGEFICTLRNETGEVVASNHQPGMRFTPDQFHSVATSMEPLVEVVSGDRVPTSMRVSGAIRVALYPFIGADHKKYILSVGRIDTVAQEVHWLIIRILIFSSVIGLVATGLTAYIVAGFAVRPLSEITAVARQLSPESIGRHVDLPPNSPEMATVQKELELARQRIEAGFAAQERFMSNVSHELKTPIATVLTEAQVLKAAELPSHIQDFLRSMTEELDKLARTVDGFLLLTRVRHGKVHVSTYDTCPVRDILVESYAGCAAIAKQHNVRLDLTLLEGEHEDAAVIGNSDLLRVVIDNIVRNAIRFSPAGSVIEIRTEVHDAMIHIFIRDKGPGIPPELLPHLFDRFSRSKEEERRGRGHGLGLEIALGVAELHAGTIVVRNLEGVGCEFLVKLPLAEAVTNAMRRDQP